MRGSQTPVRGYARYLRSCSAKSMFPCLHYHHLWWGRLVSLTLASSPSSRCLWLPLSLTVSHIVLAPLSDPAAPVVKVGRKLSAQLICTLIKFPQCLLDINRGWQQRNFKVCPGEGVFSLLDLTSLLMKSNVAKVTQFCYTWATFYWIALLKQTRYILVF